MPYHHNHFRSGLRRGGLINFSWETGCVKEDRCVQKGRCVNEGGREVTVAEASDVTLVAKLVSRLPSVPMDESFEARMARLQAAARKARAKGVEEKA